MKASALRTMSPDELMAELLKLRREQFDLRMQAATGQGARAHEKIRVRRDVARLKTILRELEQTEPSS